MADQTERIIIEIDGSGVKGEAQQVERAIGGIGDAADKAGKKVTTAEKGINELGGALKTTGSSAKTTERDFQSLQSTIGNAKPAQAQADALKQVANSAKQSASEMSNLGRTARGGVGQIRGITSAATPAASAMSSLSGAAGLLVRALPLVGTAAAAINLTGLISQSTQLAARYETLGVVMNVVGKNAGYTSGEMERYDKSLQKTGISMAESRNNLAKMASANIDLANATKLARIAQDAAVIGNMNSSQAFESLIYGIQSAQVEVLRTIGINVNFEQSYKKLADQLGKTSNELTEAEKTQARLNAVMEKAPSIAGAYEASMDTVGKKLGSTERLAENAKTMLGALFLPSWTAAVDAYSAALVQVNEELEGIDVGKAQILGRALADVFQSPNVRSVTMSGAMFDLWERYQSAAEDANVAVKKSFVDTWGEIERVGMNSANTFIASEDQRKATIQKSNDEILESFRKLNQTQIDKLDEQREAFLKAGVSRAEVDSWYAGARAKADESVTKKHSAELKKQVSDAKKARAEMLAGGKTAEQAMAEYWENYENRRINVISENAAKTVKIRTDAEEEAAKAATAILEKQQSDAQKVMDRIQDATADVFYDLFKNIGDGWATLWDSMKNWALRTLAELAAQAAVTRIVVPVLMSATGTSTPVAAVNSLVGGQGGFSPSSLSSLVSPGSMLSKIPGMDSVTSLLGSTLPGTATALSGAFSGVGAGTGMYATGLGFAPGAVANGALQGMTLGGQSLATAAPAMTSGLTIGSALGMSALGGLGYSLLGGSLGLPQNQYTGITSSIGGALGAWGGTALGGVIGGATAGSVVPIVGTAIGAVLGGLAGGMFGEKEMSPSVIFNAQSTAWGSTDSSRRANDGGNKRLGFEFHTKDGASSSTGVELATALEGVASTAFDSIEATLSAFGDQYVDMLDGTVVEFGRKVSGAAGGSWDFGSDMDFEKLFAEYSGKLQGAILAASEGAFNAAGRDIAGSEDATSALSMLAEKAATQFTELQAVIQAGVQSGDVNAYAAQIQSFQIIVQSITSAWDSVSQASAELVNPLTQYEQAQRSVNQQYDVWIAQLEAIGFASEKVAQIDADRAAVLGQLADENRKAIDDVLQTSAQIATPLSDAESAVQRVNEQFDSLVEQAGALGAAESALAQIERDRETALKRLGVTTKDGTTAIKKTITELSKSVADLTSEITSGLKAMVASARSALSTAYNAERKAIESALSATIEGLQGQIGGIDDQIGGRESAKSAWESVASSLKSAVSDIMPMSLTQAMSALDGYIQGAFAGQAPDEYGLGRAINAATSISTSDYATRADYDRAQSEAATKLSTLAGISDARVSVEQQQLDALAGQREALDAQIALAESAATAQLGALELTYENAVAQLDKLEGIEKYSGSMDNALAMIQSLTRQYGAIQASLASAQSIAAQGTYDAMQQAVAILTKIKDGMSSGSDVPGFAAGGYHSGGLRIVGENGPELEMTGPSRIWSADDTRAMLSGGGGSDAAEIRALREDLRAQSRAMVATQQRMTKLLERWNIDGMPEVRTA